MDEKHQYASRELRRSRLIGLLMLLLLPCVLIGAVILVQLYDAGSSSSISTSVPIGALVLVVVRLMSFECPDCGQSFPSRDARNAPDEQAVRSLRAGPERALTDAPARCALSVSSAGWMTYFPAGNAANLRSNGTASS